MAFGYLVADYCNGVKRSLLLVSLLLWAASGLASPVTLHLLSFDGPWVNGIPTYPYTLLIGGGVPFLGICDDYYHDGTPTDKWYADLTNLGTGDLTYLRFASSGLMAYHEAAWILLETRTTAPTQWPDMNYAIWNIFNPSVPIGRGAQFWINLAGREAQKQFPYVDFNLVTIATPVDIYAPPSGDQEFMYIITPEPASLILLASGALGVAGVRRKLRI